MIHLYRIGWNNNSSYSWIDHIMKRDSLITRCESIGLCFSGFREIYHMMIESSMECIWLKLYIFPILCCYTQVCWFEYIMIIGSSFYLHIYFYWWYGIRILLFCKGNYLILSCSAGDENHLYMRIHDRRVHSMRLWRRG